MIKLLGFSILLLICIGCGDDKLENVDSQSESDCEYIHSIGLSLEPMNESILIKYGFSNIAFSPIDPTPAPELSCEPKEVEILITTNGIDFENVVTLNEINGSYLIDNLQNCEFITVKIEGHHPDLNTVSATRIGLVGEPPLPQFISHPLPMEDFTLANDTDLFIYRTSSDNWYLSSIGNLTQDQLIFNDVFRTNWNPNKSNIVAGVENIDVQILPNLNGIASKYLVQYDLNTGTKEVLHEIEDHMDFKNDVYNPALYWIHDFHYSLDGQNIYFMSNKDNRGSSIFDQKVYDNIWKLDLETKEIEALTDFFPLNFDLIDFVEDPKNHGSFFISGGEREVEVETDDNTYFIDRKDIHYYNSTDNSITPIFVSNEEKEYLSINPSGDILLFTTTTSGIYELRSFNIQSQKQRQITFSDEYKPLNKWAKINWVSPSEFITNVNHDGELNFAIFNLE